MAIEEGLAYWASVTTPNTRYEPVYQVNLVVDQDTAEIYRAEVCSIRDMEEGPAFVIKRKVNGKKGPRPAPKLVDRNKVEINTKVGNGSEVRVQYNEYPWEYAGKSGVSLDFQGMQVVNLVEMKSSDGDELTPFDDGEEF